MHIAAEALGLLTRQCDGAVTRDDVGLNKFDAMRYRTEVEYGSGHDFDWWARAVKKYHRQLDELDPSIMPRLEAYIDKLDTGPFVITRGTDTYYIVNVSRARKDDAKQKVLDITGKRALIWTKDIERKWTVHRKFVPALLQSSDFMLDEEAIPQQEIDEIVEDYERRQMEKTLEQAQMNSNIDPEKLALANPLFPFQVDGVKALAPALSNGGALLADEMGLGKTIQSLALAIHFDMPAAVICPASLQFNWVDEIFKHTEDKTVHVVGANLNSKRLRMLYNGKTSRFVAADQADYIIMSFERAKKLVEDNPDPNTNKYHTMRKRLKQRLLPIFRNRLCIVDEAHYAKNPGAQRTQASLAVMRACRRCLAMTGTPILNRTEELWTILCAIGRNRDVAYNKAAYKCMYTDQINRALNAGGWYVRRLKENVLKDLPKKMRGEFTVDMTAAFQRKYENMLRGLADDGTTVACKLAIMTHLQTIANEAKVVPVTDYLLQRIEAEKYTVVSSTRKDQLHMIAKELRKHGKRVEVLDGGTTKPDRQKLKNEFQNGDYQVVLTTLKEGLDLYRADQMLLLDLDWNPGTLNQREDRIHRIGQENPVQIYRVIAAGVDLRKVQIIATKQDVVSVALDGERRSVTDTELQHKVLEALTQDARNLVSNGKALSEAADLKPDFFKG